ncbi:50S ribosome-binding GTPase [Pseudomonas sp. B21-028]|uniref:GTPase n=1 Tax=Pseudomonas TaxID=286 RepID=UPI000F0476C5|nr:MULTISPECIES: GTPase [Pseudomonas]MDB1113650.1 50S ribosome-binding GTPase [Pseudomonas extremaustralis]UVL82724.1 50S ribosome-binding GTPase [Pseudomonas sp. B21-028]
MATNKHLDLSEVLQRSLAYDPNDVLPLLEYLGMPKDKLRLSKDSTQQDAMEISHYLRKMGSNDIATLFRGGDGVPYAEVLCDVGHKLSTPGIDKTNSVEENEAFIIKKLFADALDKMSEDEKRQLFSTLGVTGKDIPYTSAGVILTQVLLKEFGGFAIYKGSLVLANMISRALLGSGLRFATNAAITRSIGMALGPIGWIASGAWLAVEIAGPAFRKTVPAVIHVAMLRQIVLKRITVGVVGEGSVGKDALFKAVFGIDTDNIHPVAGSTQQTEVYNWGNNDALRVVNFPGFNDTNMDVNSLTQDHLNHTDVFLMVVDLTRGISDVEVSRLRQLKTFGRPIAVCLNKVDLPRPADKPRLLEAARQRLEGVKIFETAFDPDPRLYQDGPLGAGDVRHWVLDRLREADKDVSHL